MPLHPVGTLIFGHQYRSAFADPADVLGHLGIDPIFSFACTTFTPAHNAGNKIGVSVARDVWPTAVTLAGVLLYCVIAGTEHALRDAELRGSKASLSVYIGESEALQDSGRPSIFTEAAKTADHAFRLPHQDLQEEVRD